LTVTAPIVAERSPRPGVRVRPVIVALLFLMPNLLGFLIFTLGPVLFSLAASFTNWDLQRPGQIHWIALENFRELASDSQFWLYLINTIYLMLGIPFSIAASLVIALLLNQKLRGIVVYRTLLYLPSFTAGVALMILWKALYNPDYGPINALINSIFHALGATHLSAPRWLGSMNNLVGLQPERLAPSSRYFGLGARDALIIMGIWTVAGGNSMLLYLAALSNVPIDLYEAASLDGAGQWKIFWNVTWPQLAPTTFFIVIMSLIGGLQGGFEQARILTQGGPAGTTTTLAYYIYSQAFERFQIGYASAISWVLFLFILVFTLVYWRYGEAEVN
jgi:multiple sugar transport system permease protein